MVAAIVHPGPLEAILARLDDIERRLGVIELGHRPTVIAGDGELFAVPEQVLLPSLGVDVDIANLFAGKWSGISVRNETAQKTLCEVHRRAWRMPRPINPKSKKQALALEQFATEKRPVLDVAHAIIGMRTEPTTIDRRSFNGFDYLARRFDVYLNLGVTRRGPVLRARILDGRWKTEEHVWLDSEGDHHGR